MIRCFLPKNGLSLIGSIDVSTRKETICVIQRNLRLIGLVGKFNPFAKDNRHRCIRATIPVVRQYEGRRWLDERLR